MTEQKILIESLDQGYVVTDYTADKKYAVESSAGVLRILKKALGIPAELSSESSIVFIAPKMPHGTASKPTEEITEPAPAIPVPVPEQKQTALLAIQHQHQLSLLLHHHPVLPAPFSVQPREMAAGSILKSDLLIPRFKYDTAQAQKKEIQGYKNTSVVEMPDGRAVVMYKGSHYYTTKGKVLQIPYPIPRGFLRTAGFSSSVGQTCISAYRHYLATAEKLIDAAADGKDTDTDESDSERVEKLEATAKVNENRWKKGGKGQAEEKRQKKTAELREMAIKMGIQ